MFELSVACKYLIPRRRQLSVSIISLISILVITLVVWLIVVFFSVTEGLEKNWINKLTSLTAPVRITPTEAYYQSYYYLVDNLSEDSGYSYKTIREKKESLRADPYNPEYDEEIPSHWPMPDLQADGSLIDPVQLAYASLGEIKGVPGLKAQDFELTAAHIRMRLIREMDPLHHRRVGTTQSFLSYPTYLGNFEADNSRLKYTLQPLQAHDLNNYLQLIGIAESSKEEEMEEKIQLPLNVFRRRLQSYFSHINVKELQPRSSGWLIPRNLLPSHAEWSACAVMKEQSILRLVIPALINGCAELKKNLEGQGLVITKGKLSIEQGNITFLDSEQNATPLLKNIPLLLAAGNPFSAQLIADSLEKAKKVDDIKFDIHSEIQKTALNGSASFKGLEIASADFKIEYPDQAVSRPFWVHQQYPSSSYHLPIDNDVGEGVLLPKSFKDAGVLLGDRGALSYFAPTASLLQEHQVPVYVAGFYDPGIIPIGGKFVLASQEVTSLIRASHQSDDKSTLTNGINVRFDRLDQADNVKAQLTKAFKDKGISRYWKVQTYREYEFTKEIMQELLSQKHIFMLISIVIVIVACSNIISMLVILVNDKKVEIGILRSMGASSKSIALIFGIAGGAVGIIGSIAGIITAIFTLGNLGKLIELMSRLQGYEMFNASIYGQMASHELSYEALFFVLAITGGMSLLAGIVPAMKACLLKPSQILRSSGG
ncbi:MAG: FtsX-like permease family protein [Candidatus Protochlamydia sp.]|nr:FtsX-like permease family protein [Candidatus Protochlamydia sp.]